MGDEPTTRGASLGIDGLTDVAAIGQGSFGVVYRARQAEYRRDVAVKVLTTPLLDEDARRRFEREREALGQLSAHPHIVTLFSAGVTDDRHPYMVMQLVAGGSLKDRVERHGALPWQEALDIGVKIAGALADAHAAGILHRDVKPENILVDEYGEPQLADFGVARIGGASPTATASGTITGSLAHAAPEVISGVPSAPPADIWALASTLSTLVAGRAPFHRDGDESLVPLINRILTAPPRDLRELGIPDEAAAAIGAGLAKDTWARPQTAVEFAEVLQGAQRSLGEPVTPIKASSYRPPERAPVEAPSEEPSHVAGVRPPGTVVPFPPHQVALPARLVPSTEATVSTTGAPAALEVLSAAVPGTAAAGSTLDGVGVTRVLEGPPPAARPAAAPGRRGAEALPGRRRRRKRAIACGVAAVIVAVIAVLALRGGSAARVRPIVTAEPTTSVPAAPPVGLTSVAPLPPAAAGEGTSSSIGGASPTTPSLTVASTNAAPVGAPSATQAAPVGAVPAVSAPPSVATTVPRTTLPPSTAPSRSTVVPQAHAPSKRAPGCVHNC